jgi:hypothetical protein
VPDDWWLPDDHHAHDHTDDSRDSHHEPGHTQPEHLDLGTDWSFTGVEAVAPSDADDVPAPVADASPVAPGEHLLTAPGGAAKSTAELLDQLEAQSADPLMQDLVARLRETYGEPG